MRETNLYKKVWQTLQIISVFIWGKNSYSGDNTFFLFFIVALSRETVLEKRRNEKVSRKLFFFFQCRQNASTKWHSTEGIWSVLKFLSLSFFCYCSRLKRYSFVMKKKMCAAKCYCFQCFFFLVVTCTQAGIRLLLQLSNAKKNWYSNGKIYVWQIFPNSCETNLKID